MDDRRLTWLSLVLAAAGIAALFVLTIVLQPEAVALSAIGDSHVGDIVAVEANLSQISDKDGNLFLTLEEGGARLRAVYWESDARASPEAYNLEPGDRVSATGQVAVYRGELELIIKKVGKTE